MLFFVENMCLKACDKNVLYEILIEIMQCRFEKIFKIGSMTNATTCIVDCDEKINLCKLSYLK